MNTYIALLRGINVGGHHKVPMITLKEELKKIGFNNILTLLNSGNVIFESENTVIQEIEEMISTHLEQFFGFKIPVLVRKGSDIVNLVKQQPFSEINITKDTRLYITFLKENNTKSIVTPWASEDQSFQIVGLENNMVYSVLDLSKTKTPKGMEVLEKLFSKEITTRNWNTVVKLNDKVLTYFI